MSWPDSIRQVINQIEYDYPFSGAAVNVLAVRALVNGETAPGVYSAGPAGHCEGLLDNPTGFYTVLFYRSDCLAWQAQVNAALASLRATCLSEGLLLEAEAVKALIEQGQGVVENQKQAQGELVIPDVVKDPFQKLFAGYLAFELLKAFLRGVGGRRG